MPGKSLEINTQEALDDAQNIVNIVNDVNAAMEELDGVVRKNVGGEGSGKAISTEWGGELLQEWTRIFDNDIPVVKSEMTESAQNLEKAVQGATQYSVN
ncbi:MAG: hypothetical protein IJH13_01270 [Bacilli bacterium]|nr:hypothetical protein [Bacilli bacterium]